MSVTGDHADVRLYGPRIAGGNPHAGLGDAAYSAAREGQHGIEVIGGSGCVVKNYAARDVYADFFYVGGGAKDTILCGADLDRNGRQGVSITWADGVLICGVRMDNVRRAFYDLETNTVHQYVRNVEIYGGELGLSRLNFLSAYGSGDVSNLNVHDIVMHDTMAITCTTPTTMRRSNWTISNITSTLPQGTSSGYTMLFTRLDGVHVHGCNVALQANRNMVIAQTVDCTGVDVSGNQYAKGVGQVRNT